MNSHGMVCFGMLSLENLSSKEEIVPDNWFRIDMSSLENLSSKEEIVSQ